LVPAELGLATRLSKTVASCTGGHVHRPRIPVFGYLQKNRPRAASALWFCTRRPADSFFRRTCARGRNSWRERFRDRREVLQYVRATGLRFKDRRSSDHSPLAIYERRLLVRAARQRRRHTVIGSTIRGLFLTAQ